MQRFDDNFKDSLRTIVREIEDDSGVEVVVTLLPRSDRYILTPVLFGGLAALTVLTVMMFVPTEYWYVLIYLETLASFVLGMGLLLVFPALNRLLHGRKWMRQRVQTMAHALFHKAGIHETKMRVGVLVVLSWYEREALIMPDTGARDMIPPDVLEDLEAELCRALHDGDPVWKVLGALRNSKEVFATYIPRLPDDINELPDELWME